MNILNVFYFGSSKDGFNVYPDSDLFSHYYNNAAPEPWMITVRRIHSIIYYTYIQYGLKTSHNDGREGSHIGISISMENYYFGDLKFLYTIFLAIIKEMLKDECIIQKNNFERIAFVPYRLSKEKEYLDAWTEIIKREFEKKELTAHLLKIPPHTPVTYEKNFGFHINNKKEIFQSYFEKYGALEVSNTEEYPLII